MHSKMPLALVTGANRGLGLETARRLVAHGWSVMATSRDDASGREAARLLGEGVRFVPLDVTDPDSIGGLAAALEREPPLDALVNNAGASFDGFDGNVAQRTVEVNFRGPMRLTDALLPRLGARACVVMVSSGMGELSHFVPELRRRFLDPALDRPGLEALVGEFVAFAKRGDLGVWPRNAYGVSKAALNAFTRILGKELEGTGRRVNAICPGWVRTRMGGRSAPRSVERGARGIVWAAMLGADGPNGGFFRDEKPIAW